MKVIIATTQVPFIFGGAEIHARELCKALQRSGHQAEIVAIPFQTYPTEKLLDSMLSCRLLDLTSAGGQKIDRLIGLKFPAYLIPHPCKVLWILHQHRQAYELWGDINYSDLDRKGIGLHVRESIIRADNKVCAEARAIFSNSQNVARRLKTYNNVDSIPLYHPPQNAGAFYNKPEEGYFFYPSRINAIKRQELVIEALAKTVNPVKVVFAGQPEGNIQEVLDNKIETLGLADRVTFLGRISDEEKIDRYARCLATIYTPYEEDYGYVTLEAMLAAKPVITCTDCGGPLEFIYHRKTGLVAEPSAASLAGMMDDLWENRAFAGEMGKAGLDLYNSLDITWSNVIRQLLA